MAQFEKKNRKLIENSYIIALKHVTETSIVGYREPG